MDQKKLLKLAVDYLSKYDSSKKNLINVLKRKISKLNLDEVEKNILIKFIDNIILKLEKNNLIDDNRFCNSKIVQLSRSGKSKNYIFNYLMIKGVDKLKIQNNLKKFEVSNNNWEVDSATVFIKKKRLLSSNFSYEKKISKMARAGFSYEICKKLLG